LRGKKKTFFVETGSGDPELEREKKEKKAKNKSGDMNTVGKGAPVVRFTGIRHTNFVTGRGVRQVRKKRTPKEGGTGKGSAV